jgi:hypothetical protein
MHVDALLAQDSWSAEQHNECLGQILGRCELGLKRKQQNDDKRYLRETGCKGVKWTDEDRI